MKFSVADLILPCALSFALVAPSWAQTASPVTFEQSAYSVDEAAGVVTATVRLADDRMGGGFSVTGTVTALDDVSPHGNYDVSTSPVAFRLDQTATRAAVRILVVADEIPEEEETISLRLLSFGHPASEQTATVTITDDDGILVGFERTLYSSVEGDVASVCVAMMTPAAAVPVEQGDFSLEVTTRPGTAGFNDFTRIGGFFNPGERVFTFGHGTRSACFDFETIEDDVSEDEEEAFLDLTVAPGSSLPARGLLNPAVTGVAIADNDPIIVGFASTRVEVVEGAASSVTVCVQISGPARIERSDFLLSLRTMDGSASAGSDYSAPTTPTLGPFGSGGRRECANVGIIDDEASEPSETFQMFLATTGSPGGVVVDPSSLTVAIMDDDAVMDYSSDGRLIDVRTPEQLHAMRWDLDGDGRPDPANATSYTAAFPDAAPNMGCAATCAGYALAGDVDLGASRFGRGRGGEGWQPLGDKDSDYDADFDGRGHVITGLYVNRPASDHVGLFGRISAGTSEDERSIQNLGLVDVDVTGANKVGALAGQISTTTVVTTIYAAGGSVTGANEVGGLVGLLEDDVIAVYASVAVSGANNVGGLAGAFGGRQSRNLSASYAAGRVAGISNVGGLVGFREQGRGVAAASSYWDTLASGQSASALGVGMNTAALQTPTTYDGIYANWNVDVDGDGSADNPWNFGTSDDYPLLLLQSRIAISITGTATVAEGDVATYTVVASSAVPYRVAVDWSVGMPAGAAPEAAATAGDFRADGQATTPLSAFPTGTAILQAGTTGTTFSVYVFDDEARENSESFRVGVRVAAPDGRITLSQESSAVIVAIESSDGIDYDADNDGLISVATPAQLAAIRYDLAGSGIAGVSDANRMAYRNAFPFYDEAETCSGAPCDGYELANDVDLSGVDWIPIGGGNAREPFSEQPPVATRYQGLFEGNGYVIRNMSISSAPRYDHVGLFGALGAAGTIRSVGLVGVNIDVRQGDLLSDRRSRNTGALVGASYGTIASSYVVRGSVRGDFTVGGLAGRLGGTVIASYAAVSVQARLATMGGLAGFADSSAIVSASYTSGTLETGDSQIGGLIGLLANPAGIQSSYFDGDRSGRSSCCGAGAPRADQTSRTSHALRVPTTAAGIYAGWDELDVDDDSVADSPWDFGTPFDYPVLVFGGDDDGRPARRTSQQQEQPAIRLAPTLAGSETIAEGATANYVVRLPLALPAGVVASWSWSVGGGAVGAGDFAGTTSGRTVIAPGASSASFSLMVAADGVAESAEAFEVSMTNALLTGAPDDVRLGVPGAAARTTIAANGVRRVTPATVV